MLLIILIIIYNGLDLCSHYKEFVGFLFTLDIYFIH